MIFEAAFAEADYEKDPHQAGDDETNLAIPLVHYFMEQRIVLLGETRISHDLLPQIEHGGQSK